MNRSRTTRTTVAVALAVAGFTPAAASARPDLGLGAGTQPHTQIVRVPETQIVRIPAHDGFDWADAGIGGATVLGLTLVMGGGLVASRRRGARPAQSAAVAR